MTPRVVSTPPVLLSHGTFPNPGLLPDTSMLPSPGMVQNPGVFRGIAFRTVAAAEPYSAESAAGMARSAAPPGSGSGRRRGARRLDDETGSTLPLVACFAALAAGLILVITAASSLYLERKRLFTVADGAALAAAESWSFTGVDARGTPVTEFDRARLVAAAEGYLAEAEAAAEFADFRVRQIASDDSRGVVVTLTATWRWGGPTSLVPVAAPIEVTATARSIIR